MTLVFRKYRVAKAASKTKNMLSVLPAEVFCTVQNAMGKLTVRKIGNMQLWQFVYSVAGKLNPLNFNNCRLASVPEIPRKS